MGSRAASWVIAGCLSCAFARADDAAVGEASYSTIAMTAEDAALVGVGTASAPAGYVNKKDPWIDRAHQGVFNAVWRSAMRMDQMFGGGADEAVYMQTTGSIAPALLYDELD